ncbi:pericentrin-like [Gossypium australe]|uniref:Pericentrin-like n=1 Tax=Gossypium australe TaxID=47621 RepID=A0A5B6V7V2_9ROSI|nr:pericentrin-like [Gossypium australe]
MAELGRSFHHHRSCNFAIELKSSLNKIEEMKGKIEELESALHSCELQIELLETREGRWKEELHHSQDQILASQADTLSMKYKLQSDRSQELASLLGKIKTLGLRERERERERKKENLEAEHPYSTRAKSRKMDQRMEQFQRDIQDQIQEQMTKLQQEMRDQMLKAQRNMMAQMAQMLSGATDKGKGLIVNAEDNEDFPRGFTLQHVQTQPEEYPRRPTVTIRPQQGQANTGVPINF